MPENDINCVIGRNIRIRRSLQGFSQAVLAELLGVTFQQVQKYEKGRNTVSPARLVHLAAIFECGVEELFREPVFDSGLVIEQGKPANIPGRRSLHLVQSFERIESLPLQKQIGDLVRAIADYRQPDKKDFNEPAKGEHDDPLR